MGFDLSSALKNAREATEDFIAKNKEKKAARDAAAQAQAEAEAAAARVCAEHNAFLALVAGKLTGTSAEEMPPLVCDVDTSTPSSSSTRHWLAGLGSSGAQQPMFGPPPDSTGGDAGNPYLNSSASFYHRQIMRATAAVSSAAQQHLPSQSRNNGQSSYNNNNGRTREFAAMPPPTPPRPHRKAVFFVTTPIEFGPIALSRSTYKLLAKHVGMSLNSVSHWALCVVDRSPGAVSWCYDLMSDHLSPIQALGKSYLRVYSASPEFVNTWASCYYVGETTLNHEQIQELGRDQVALNPRYNIVNNNCQDLVEGLVRQLCDDKVISQAKLSEELSLASPKIALDLMVARLRTRVDALDQHEDNQEVQEDMDTIKSLWHKVHQP